MAIEQRIDDYSYIIVRVNAARAKLLRAEQLDDLAKSPTTEEFKQKLATYYRDLTADAINNSKDLENTLYDALFKYLNLILYNAPHECQEFLVQYIEKYAFMNLKTLLIGKILKKEPREIKERIYHPIERLLKTDGIMDDALKATSMEGVIYQYKRTRYGQIMKDIMSQYSKNQEIFFIYSGFDKAYIENLNMLLLFHEHWSHARNEFLRIFIGTLTDFFNLVTCIRAQLNHFDWQEIKRITTPVQLYYKVFFNDFEQLFALKEDTVKIIDTLKKIALRYPEGYRFTNYLSPDKIMVGLRQFYYNVLLSDIRRHRFESGNELADIIAFMVEKEAEIENLITIFEGIKNQADLGFIQNFLKIKGEKTSIG